LALGPSAVSTDGADIAAHGSSPYSTSSTPNRPVAVVRPTSTAAVSTIAQICTRHRVPMVPFGAGSSVEGNFTSPHSGVCIDLSSMDRILSFRPDDMDVTVQPGVNWVDLNTHTAGEGLWLPVDPSPTAHVGGMIATNASGTNATRHGTMRDYVVNLTVVLADGTVVKTRRRPRKTSAGYNLNGLVAGAEGTLGVVTEATLRLVAVPRGTSVATATFPSVKRAAEATVRMMRAGVPLAAVELMDDVQMAVVNKSGGAGGRVWAERPTLFLK
jgi:D-lactate dehydrogenase (cytochrome)